MVAEEKSSTHTTGAAILASHFIGCAMTIAIRSAERRASCLGTSSPITRLA